MQDIGGDRVGRPHDHGRRAGGAGRPFLEARRIDAKRVGDGVLFDEPLAGVRYVRNDDERGRAAKAGITDLDRIYSRDEMVTADVIFAATGVTTGSIVRGVRREPGFIETETILMRSKTGSVRRMIYRNPIR